jgi:hypothetical protein
VITKYVIEFADASGANWIEQLDYCDGSKASFVSSLNCVIPMNIFRAAPYNYSFRDLVKVRAKAYNSFGWSLAYSPVNTSGAQVRIEPTKMSVISVVPDATTITQISLIWPPLTTGVEIGDSTILSYNLQWDAGSGGATEADWIDLVGSPANQVLTSFVVTSGIVGGQWFKFRVRAKNIYGFGLFSDAVQFKAS